MAQIRFELAEVSSFRKPTYRDSADTGFGGQLHTHMLQLLIYSDGARKIARLIACTLSRTCSTASRYSHPGVPVLRPRTASQLLARDPGYGTAQWRPSLRCLGRRLGRLTEAGARGASRKPPPAGHGLLGHAACLLPSDSASGPLMTQCMLTASCHVSCSSQIRAYACT